MTNRDPSLASAAVGAADPGPATPAAAALVPQPAPLRRPSPLQLQRRAAATATAATRSLGPGLARWSVRREVPRRELGAALRELCARLGSTYVKFGQLVASAPGLFGEEVADEMRALLDEGDALPFPVVLQRIERTLGQPARRVFADIDPVPIGRASIAVVHRAVRHDGREVVVKVVRPGVAGAVAADLALLRGIGPLLLRRAGDEFGARMLLPVLDALAEQLGEELDLRNEARAMELVAGLLDPVHLPDVVVPEVHADLSGDKVLTMTFLDGVPIDDPSAIEALGHDPTPRVEQIVRAWFLTLLRHGVFHGDVHAGNLLLLRDGRVGLIDWGIVGRLGADTHRAVRSMIGAALGDPVAMEELVDDMIATFGGLFEVEVDRDLVRALVADVVGGLLTKPFGEVQLSTMLVPPTEHHAAITGREAPAQPSVAGLDAQAESFDRHMFLVAKQLLYFERYGKQYLSEVPLLHDEAFFWSLLEQDTAR